MYSSSHSSCAAVFLLFIVIAVLPFDNVIPDAPALLPPCPQVMLNMSAHQLAFLFDLCIQVSVDIARLITITFQRSISACGICGLVSSFILKWTKPAWDIVISGLQLYFPVWVQLSCGCKISCLWVIFPLTLSSLKVTQGAKPCCNLDKLAGQDSKGEELRNSASVLKRRNSAVDFSGCQHRNPASSWNARREKRRESSCPTLHFPSVWAGAVLAWPPSTSVKRVVLLPSMKGPEHRCYLGHQGVSQLFRRLIYVKGRPLHNKQHMHRQ